jgi:hypothetical protein
VASLGTFDTGDTLRLGNHSGATDSAAFSVAGVATDPTAVTMTVTKPTGTSTVYAWPTPGVGQSALTKEGTGRFYADVALDVAGVWRMRLAGTGAVATAEERSFVVRRSRV